MNKILNDSDKIKEYDDIFGEIYYNIQELERNINKFQVASKIRLAKIRMKTVDHFADLKKRS
jgi:hypothetical protein